MHQCRDFVSEGQSQPRPWGVLKPQIYPGSESFVEEMQCKISPDTNSSEIPSSQKRQLAKSLEYYEKEFGDRGASIVRAYESGGYSLKNIGDYYSLHYSRVSRIVRAKSKTCTALEKLLAL